MSIFKRVIIGWKLRSKCSICGKKGEQIDDHNFSCSVHGCWDGNSQFVEAVNYEKNRYAEVRNLVTW